jgi:hypothetical protein
MLSFITTHLIYPLIIPGFLAGIISIIVSIFVPTFFPQYKYILQAVGAVLILVSTFMGGHWFAERSIAIERAEVQAENARLASKSTEATLTSTIQYIEKIKYVDRWKEVKTNVYITSEADQKCVIDPATRKSIRMLYNGSIQGLVPEATGTSNGSTTEANPNP